MSKVNTSKLRDLLSRHIGNAITEGVHECSKDTRFWLYCKGTDILAFDDLRRNELYIFDTPSFLRRYVLNNGWTYDLILDFDSGASCYYVQEYRDNQVTNSCMEFGKVTEEDAEELYHRIADTIARNTNHSEPNHGNYEVEYND